MLLLGPLGLGCGGWVGELRSPPGADAAVEPPDAEVDQPDAGPGEDGGAPPDSGSPNDGGAPPDGGEVGPAYRFVVFGDNQFATSNCTSGVNERLAIPKAVLDFEPTFVLHTGDLMDHGHESGAYARLETCYAALFAKHPFFPTMGNHDATGVGNYAAYLAKQLFTTNPKAWGPTYSSDFTIAHKDDPTAYSTDWSKPSHLDVVPSGVSFKTQYAFRHRNAYFISFEQGTRYWTNTPKTWVEKHLKAARADPSIDHVFVYLHHPIYSTTMSESGSGECLQPVRSPYEGLFRKYDVTAVFSGHAHTYDRLLVPDDGTSTRARPSPTSYPRSPGQVHYLVTGGGGGPLPGNCPSEQTELSYQYSQAKACGYHIVVVDVQGPKLTFRAVGVAGNGTSHTKTEWDRFTIEPP